MAKKNNTAVEKFKNVGVEDVSVKDLSISFIKLVQKTSNVPGAKAGDIVDSVSGRKLDNPLIVVPIKKFIDWVKFNDDFMICGRSVDGKTWDDGEELTEEERWKNKRINFFVYLEDQDTATLPYCISFGKSSFKAGQKMANISDKHILMGAPIFSQKFKLSTKETKFNKNTAFVWEVELAGDVDNEDFMDEANKMRESINSRIKNDTNLLASHKEEAEEAEEAEEPKAETKKSKRRF